MVNTRPRLFYMKESASYQCPMRCEESKTYNHPGKCPICNMNLVIVNRKKFAG